MSLAISPAARAALEDWLTHLRALDGRADKTVIAYAADLQGWLSFLGRHRGGTEGLQALVEVPLTDLRSWMAHERGRGVSARSLARSLSAVKGFTGWLADRNGWDATVILQARAPRFQKNCPVRSA